MHTRWFNAIVIAVMLLGMVPFSAQAAPLSEIDPEPIAQITGEGDGPPAEIESALLNKLADEGTADFVVVMAEQADLSKAYEIEDWEERGKYVYEALRATASRTQAPVMGYAIQQDLEYESFFSVNTIHIKGGDLRSVQDIASLPGVALVRRPQVAYIDPYARVEGPSPLAPTSYGWNLDALDPDSNLYGMQAAQVWDQYGIRGEGIIVANIDTGVTYEHEALVRQYRGNLSGGAYDHDFNWYAPTTDAQVQCGGDAATSPCDEDGHGSGTAGIMVGETEDLTEQNGAAPASKWIACMGCDGYGPGGLGGCSEAALTGCADWYIAPCPIGVDPGDPSCDPSQRPHIINNSWGDVGGRDWYRGYIQAWVAAGMFPAFSAGNTAACAAVGSPGDNPEAFGTAAHNSTGQNLYAGGPSFFFPNPSCDPEAHEVDPHLNAPTFGRAPSHVPGGYYNIGGTSGASPHTAGAVALMWAANPGLVGDILNTFTILEQSSNHNVPEGGCGKPACAGANVYPNYEYGWGYLDALAAVEEAQLYGGGIGYIDGQVTDADSDDPVQGATVMATLEGQDRAWQTLTDESGIYDLTVFSGTYMLDAFKYGYSPAQITSLSVVSGTTTTQNIALTPAAFYEVSGQVTDAATGWPLYAKINIAGYPGDPVWTDPETGAYSISLAEGVTYTFQVEAWVDGYDVAERIVGPLTGDTTEDFALEANVIACMAPGYQPVFGYMEDFEADDGSYTHSGTPDDWEWGTPTVWPNGCASGDYCWGTNLDDNYANNADETLLSPVIDLSGVPLDADLSVTWQQAWHIESASYDHAYAEVSIDGGPWQQMWSHTDGTVQVDWTEIGFDISDAAGGTVQFRWRFTSDGSVTYSGYYIDDVFIQLDCEAPIDGGLVVGNVYDANYPTMALDGADVVNDTGEMGVTADGGFYTLFSPSGNHVFTATMEGGYAADAETVAAVNGDTIRQDFALPAGLLSATPAGVEAVVPLGYVATETLSLGNIGGAAAMFELGEADMGFDILGLEQKNEPRTDAEVAPTSLPIRPQAFADELFRIDAEGATGHLLLLGVEYVEGSYFVTSGGETGSGDPNYLFELDFEGGLLNSWPQSTSSVWGWRDMAFDGDYLYASDSAVVDQIDPATGQATGITIPCPTNPCRALAYDPATDHFWTASFSSDIWEFDRDGNIINQYANSLAIYGAAWDMWSPDGPFLWVWSQDGSVSHLATQIDPATGQSTGVSFEGVPDLTGGSAGGATISPYVSPGKLAFIGMHQATPDTIVGYDLDVVVSVDAVPWLSEDPITGTVASSGSEAIEVVFDAAYVNQPGEYYAELVVGSDTPYESLNVPVTMTVEAPNSWAKLTGTVTGLGACDDDPAPLEEAEVHVESATTGHTWTVTTDISGTYQLWLDQAHSPLTVTVSAPDYYGQEGGVEVVQGETTVLNFDLRLLQPCLSYDPADFDVTLPMGDNLVETLTLSNTGEGDAAFELVEIAGDFMPQAVMSLSPSAIPTREPLPGYDPDALTTADVLSEGGTPEMGILAAGDVLAQWASGLALPWGTGFSLQQDNVWLGNIAAGGGDDNNYEFAPDGTPTGRTVSSAFGGVFAADIAYNPNTGMFWQVDVGGDNCIHEWDPASGITGNSICDAAWTWTNQRGLAYDPTDDTFFIGGWNDTDVYHIDNTGAVIEQWTLGLGVSGLAYNFEAGYLFIIENSSTDAISVFDVASGSIVDTFTVTGFGSYVAAGLAIDCDGNLWAANMNDFNAYLIDSGVPANLCAGIGGNIPWLSEDPITGTIDTDTDALVNLTFDAGVPETMQPGEYYGELKVVSNAANDVPNIPLTLTVTAPDTWGKLTGEVSGLGYCDTVTPTLLEDAEITVESGAGPIAWSLTTDVSGTYQLWLDAAHNPLTVTVEHPEHATWVFTDVMVTAGDTTVLDAALRWAQPCLSAEPIPLELTVTLGMSETIPFSVTNDGAEDAAFDLVERNGGFNIATLFSLITRFAGESDPSARTAPEQVGFSAPVYIPTNPDILLDEGFEGGTVPPTDWDTEVSNAGFTWKLHTFDPHTGSYAADVEYDPALVLQDEWLLSPEMPLAEGTLSFWSFGSLDWCRDTNDNCDLNVWIVVGPDVGDGDDIYVGKADDDWPADWTWAQTVFDLTPLLPGGPVRIGFQYEGVDGAQVALDDILLDGVEGSSGIDIPWLFEDPVTGTVNADSTFIADLTFDATDAVTQVTQPGEYFGTLFVTSDDPVNDNIPVPVTMTVEPPATWGKLMGTVQSLGYCDADPAPVADQEVLIEGSGGVSWTLTTDVSGTYQLWLDEMYSPLTMTVAAPDHEKGEVTGVMIISDTTTTQDFDLRWLAPCVAADPLALHATLELGAFATETLTLTNTGAVGTAWDIEEESLDIVWLSEDPVTGTLVADTGQQIVNVNFDASAVDRPGEYYANLWVNSDDQMSPFVVSVTMTVNPPASWGQLRGVVSATGHCDVNLAPLAGADVLIESWLTETITISVPLIEEGFEGAFQPAGWVLTQTGAIDDPGWVQTTARANNGAYSAYHDDADTSGDSIAWMIMPQVAIPAGGAELAFWQNQNFDTWYAYHGIWVSTASSDPADFSEMIELGAGTEDTWEEVTLDLSAYAGQSIYIAFRYEGDYADEWYVDDVVISYETQAIMPLYSVNLTTDISGTYHYWLAPGTYTVTASAADHTNVVEVITITAGVSQTQDFILTWLGPCVTSIEPSSMEVTLAMGMSETLPLTMTNVGAGALYFEFNEVDVGFVPTLQMLTSYQPPDPSDEQAHGLLQYAEAEVSYDHTSALPAPSATTLLDQPPNQDNGIFSDVGCDNCTSGAQAIAENFTLSEGKFIDQVVFWTGYYPGDTPIDPDNITVIFHSDNAGLPGADIYVEANVAYERVQTGVVLFGVHEWMHTLTLGSPVALPPGNYWIEIYNDTGSGTDDFFWETGDLDPANGLTGSAWAPTVPGSGWNYDAATDLSIQLLEASDIPWLFEDPESGTVPLTATGVADITFDAGVPEVTQPGDYFGELQVNNNDPVWDGFTLPVTMHVTLPVTYGQVTGTVAGLGPCDDPLTAEPLEGADILVASATQTWTLTTDADGTYAIWLDEAHSPVTITVDAMDYASDTVTGVTVISGTTTTAPDVALRPLAPCATVTPLMIEESLTLGMSTTVPITIGNTGAYTLAWTLSDGGVVWTDQDPTAGETAPDGGTSAVTVTLDTADFDQPGTYTATLFVDNDSINDPLTVPVTLTVEPPATWGKLEGLVQGLGYCDAMTMPLEGARVWIQSWMTETVAAGLEEDFEGNDGSFAGSLDWEWGTYNWVGGNCDGDAYPPSAAHSGTDMWGTVLNDCYNNLGDTSVLSFEVDLSSALTATLSWWDWYDIYESFDHGEVYVNGVEVYDRATSYVIPTAWEQHQVDLTPYVGGVATVEFRMYATTVVNRAGWYIDDVRIDTDANEMIERPVTWLLTTDISGTYGIWLDEMYSPLTVTIAHEAGYAEQVFTAVDIVSGAITTLDANLHWLQPCLTPTPDALGLSVPMGTTTTAEINLANMGAFTGSFMLSEWSLGFDELGPLAAAGPDGFGYRFADSNEFGIRPVYDFVDISTIGTPLALGDNDYAEVDIGFDFKFYGADALNPNLYDTVFVGSNGFLSFGTASTDLSPDPALPDPTLPNNLVAAAWDDLVPGTVYVQSFAQCPYNPIPNTVDACFIVQYDDFTHPGGALAGTWEVILFHSGSILMQYAEVDAPDATTGIENQFGNIGLNYGPTLADELAICFAYPGEWLDCQSTQVPWLDVDIDEGDLAAYDELTVTVTLDASVTEIAAPGDYLAELIVTSDDPVNPLQIIPVTMTVDMPTTMARLSGDIYGWGHCDAVSETLPGADITLQTEHGDHHVLTADADGAYAVWVEAGQFTMTVEHEGYLSVTLTDTVDPGFAPQQDIHLHLDAPCASVTYDEAFDVVVVQGERVTRSLTLNNDGAGLMTYDNVLATGLWVQVNPETGVVAPRDAQPVDVCFDSTGLSVGVYDSNMEIVHNDLQASRMFVRPIRMTVVADGTILMPMMDAKEGDPGETVTYVMTATNFADTAVTFDVLASGNVWTSTVPATVDVATGETVTFTVDVDIPVDAHSGYSDTVTINVESQGTDEQMASALLQTTVAEQPVVLSLTKTAAPADYVMPGDTITYTLDLVNDGNDPLTIVLTDTIPDDTTYVLASVTGGAEFDDPPGDHVAWSGVLDKGAQHTITFQVTVNAGLTDGTLITNTVTVEANGELYTGEAVVEIGSSTKYIYLPLVLRNAQ